LQSQIKCEQLTKWCI